VTGGPDRVPGEVSGPSEDPAGPASAEPPTRALSAAEREARRRRRRAAVFGDVLPEGTSDERGDTWGDRGGSSDEWLRRQVPPHHG
jgi:hypothetical protein